MSEFQRNLKKAGLNIRPIGHVQGSRIQIHKRWLKALRGIEGFSHIIVLFWLHKAGKPVLEIHPRDIKDLPRIGYLATRTQHRFNLIGVTVVKLLKRRGTTLWVAGLDAWEGTPIMDVKPYTKKECIRRFRIPGWVKFLDKAESDPLRRYGT